MRFIRQILNNFKEAAQGIWRNKGMGALSIISITAVLVLFGTVLLLVLNMTNLVNEAGNKVDRVVVYLYSEANEEDINNILTSAESTGHVEEVFFTSEEQALENFKESLGLEGDDEYFLDLLDEYPLPRSLSLKIDDLNSADSVAGAVKDMRGVELVEYPNEVIGKIIQMNDWIKILGGAIVGILLIIAIVLIHNTIKATLSNREREIHIMRYLGASNGYIRRPFLMEGIFFGLIASILAVVIVYYSYLFIFERMEQKLQVMVGMNIIPPEGVIFDVAIIFACIGIGIGFLGSSLSIKRFLNV